MPYHNHIGDLEQIKSQIELLTKAITSGEAKEINQFFMDTVLRIKALERELNLYKRHIPIILTQRISPNESYEDGVFQTIISSDFSLTQKLLLFIPKEGSVGDALNPKDNKLEFVLNDEVVKTALFYKESNNGQLVQIKKHDIVPNRTLLIRLVNAQTAFPKAVIINTSGLYDENITNLFVGGELLVSNKPMLTNNDTLVSSTELDEVKQDLNKFKEKFIFVADTSVEEAIKDAPDGAIIFEIDHD